MNRLAIVLILFFLLCSCSDDNSSSVVYSSGKVLRLNENSPEMALRVNENCSEFQMDSTLSAILQKSGLGLLKNSHGGCVTLDMWAYDLGLDTILKYRQSYGNSMPQEWLSRVNRANMFDYLLNKGDADSLIIYLVENGLDSIARVIDLMELAMFAGDTVIVRYALEKGFPVNGETVFYAIESARKDGENNRYWYETLVKYVENINDVRMSGANHDAPSALEDFCFGKGDFATTMVGYLEENDQLYIFQDLIRRGYLVNKQREHSDETALAACNYGKDTQTELQKKFTDILIRSGADVSLVK